jgi:hypothetical protein
MTEDERVWAVKQFLFDYVKSPSLRHIRDSHSVIRLAQDIVHRLDRGNSAWKKWDAQRELLLKSSIGCWIPVEDMRDFLNQMTGLRLTTIAAAGTARIGNAAFDAAVASWPHEHFTLRQGIMLIREHIPKS